MAGVIARIFKNVERLADGSPNPSYQPGQILFWTEYLIDDSSQSPVFSRDRGQAIEFLSHGQADDRAAVIRSEHPELGFVFGISCPRHAGVGSRVPSPPPRLRKEREAKMREEMRVDDLRQLEEQEVYD